MGTFLILLALVVTALVITVVALGAGGLVLVLVFGDVLVAGLIIFGIIRAVTKKKKKD